MALGSTTSGRWKTGALWCIAVGLLANAVVYWSKSGAGAYPTDISFAQVARAQGPGTPVSPVGARGVLMMPAQLGPNSYGLYLLDLDAGNIVVYEALPDKSRFHLMAARNFRNDRFLEDFNNDSPTPKEVQKLIQLQREREAIEARPGTPAEAPTPGPQQP